jgi:NitT/TauT family transport system ATP-binding protein
MLEITDLRKVYDGHGRRVEALAGVSFTVAGGEFACVVGPSGCGKTTLLRCIARLMAPTSGSIKVAGEPVAVVFQEYGRSLFPWLRVRQNVELPLHTADKRRRALDALEAVGLGDAANAYPWQLSGGMQQRVAIARAIAYGPKVLLMDEPFAAVDAQTRADLEDLIRELWRRLRMTLLFVTHDIDESVYLGQRVIVLSASPTRVVEDVAIDLPAQRDQLTTRGDPRFSELRAKIYARIKRNTSLGVSHDFA